MKTIIAIAILLCSFQLSVAGADKEQLTLEITMTTGERSRDSSSTKTTIAIAEKTLDYKVTYGGRNRGREPKHQEFKLNSADQKQLLDLIKAKNILITESVKHPVPESGPYTYFYLSVSAAINETKGMISVRGSRKDAEIGKTELYKNASAVVEAVFEIIRRTDKNIRFEPLVYRSAMNKTN